MADLITMLRAVRAARAGRDRRPGLGPVTHARDFPAARRAILRDTADARPGARVRGGWRALRAAIERLVARAIGRSTPPESHPRDRRST